MIAARSGQSQQGGQSHFADRSYISVCEPAFRASRSNSAPWPANCRISIARN